jgi:hypothetical protein
VNLSKRTNSWFGDLLVDDYKEAVRGGEKEGEAGRLGLAALSGWWDV